MLCEWKTEWMKVRRKKIVLIPAAFLLFTFLWLSWAVRSTHVDSAEDSWMWLLLCISIVNTILMPTMIAMLASRLCDVELKGNTLKLLCTMERKGRLFDMKLLTGAVYVEGYVAMELVMMLVFARTHGFAGGLTLRHLICFLLQCGLVSLGVLLFQMLLSLFSANQILPLAVGLAGSFLGLFSWFMSSPFWRVIVWSYYNLLAYIGQNWEESSHVVSFYERPLDQTALVTLLAALSIGYVWSRQLFMRRTPGCG
ncbi:MAG: ABC transporter permease [Lachnospiraceae bacterium]|nr:ABC transporter permease [Lachnospiraceae bacterium]